MINERTNRGVGSEQGGRAAPRPQAPGPRPLSFLIPLAAIIVLAIASTTIGPVLADLQASIGWLEAAVLAAASYTGIAIASPLAGRLAERFGFRRLLLAGVAFIIVAMVILVTISGPWPVFAGYVIIGFGFGCVQTSANPFVSALFPERKGAALNILHTGWSVGAFIGPMLAGYFLAAGAVRNGFMIILALAIGISIPISVLLLPGRLAVGAEAADGAAHARSRRTIVLLGLAVFFYIGAEHTVNVWLPFYLQETAGFGVMSAGLALSAFWACMGVGRVATAAVIDRVGIRRIAVLFCLAGAVIATVLATLPIAWAAIGFMQSVVFPGVMGLCYQQYGARASSAIGAVLGIGVFGGIVVPGVIGALLPVTGLVIIPLVVAAGMALTAVFIALQ